ncbi:hypothetical protein RGQ13_08715 [Thalassotalea psychrophila]|uniref:Uncharacterized protein n=1 Tax=Thalassotalea psychrophila TaxID=3065647 RepID=A0ABY9TZM6_9GAMM|nr:hypothetical protein RGQ13_08715 [Colwelliaceae bacterium SQ149]
MTITKIPTEFIPTFHNKYLITKCGVVFNPHTTHQRIELFTVNGEDYIKHQLLGEEGIKDDLRFKEPKTRRVLLKVSELLDLTFNDPLAIVKHYPSSLIVEETEEEELQRILKEAA